MKKKIIVLLFLFVILVTGVQALGLGAQFNFSAGSLFAPGVALNICPTDITQIAFNWYLDFDKVNIIGVTLDFGPMMLPISEFKAGSFNFTMGLGLFANVAFDDDIGFNGGLRIPIGLNILLGNKSAFEIFTHIAPSFGMHFIPSFGLSNPFFPIAVGARFWFR